MVRRETVRGFNDGKVLLVDLLRGAWQAAQVWHQVQMIGLGVGASALPDFLIQISSDGEKNE